MTEVMKRLRKWVISLMLIVITLIVLKMAFEIWWIPDYRGGKAYIGCSPDGRYKAMLVYPQKNEDRVVQVIIQYNSTIPVSVIPMPYEWYSLSDFLWYCKEDHDLGCTGFQAAYEVTTFLPPSLWQRLHAWLTVKIRGLENPNFIEDYTYDYRRYCEKYWND